MHPGRHRPGRWRRLGRAGLPRAPGRSTIEGWSDPFATWRHDAEIKIPAGLDVELMFAEGALAPGEGRGAAAEALGRPPHDPGRAHRGPRHRPPGVGAARAAVSPEVDDVLSRHPLRELVTTEGPYPFFADRRARALRLLVRVLPPLRGRVRRPHHGQDGLRHLPRPPRSASTPSPPWASTSSTCRRSTRSAGSTARAATTPSTPGPDDTGSPWAIGSTEGGHDAIHPDLGTMADFDAFVARAGELGLEVALDLALQAAPDHPWVTSHPEWFTTRADGSIAYAENPPKKYQDIYPINFDNDRDGIYDEVLRIVRMWMSHGVRIFRVDNPHTKPVQFWEWLLGEVRKTDPDVIFLAEAFTKPAMMRGLGTVGFHQSYTYFTWRTAKWELEEYFKEVAHETSP